MGPIRQKKRKAILIVIQFGFFLFIFFCFSQNVKAIEYGLIITKSINVGDNSKIIRASKRQNWFKGFYQRKRGSLLNLAINTLFFGVLSLEVYAILNLNNTVNAQDLVISELKDKLIQKDSKISILIRDSVYNQKELSKLTEHFFSETYRYRKRSSHLITFLNFRTNCVKILLKFLFLIEIK